MTTYTMNGRTLPARCLHGGAHATTAGEQVLNVTKVQWRLQVQPERFQCLESAEPRDQLKAALKQIESLLEENTRLMQTVLLLDHALSDAYAPIRRTGSCDFSDGEKLRLSGNYRRYMEQLRTKLRARKVE